MTIVVLAALLPTGARAEVPDKPWFLGGSISYVSSTDDIRSNAHIIFTNQFGDDGIPFTGDPNELAACAANSGHFYPQQDPFCDPRPDDLVARESNIDPGFRLDLSLGYRFNPHFTLMLQAGHRSGQVGPIEVYNTETVPRKDRLGSPTMLVDSDRSLQFSAGELTTLPLTLSGLVSFRSGKAARPYLGAGAGYIWNRLDENAEIVDIQRAVSAERVRGWSNEYGLELTDPIHNGTLDKEDGLIPFELPIDIRVDEGYEWHLSAGLEYQFNDWFSLVFDATYSFTRQKVEIDFGGEDQIDVLYWPGALFRPDGTLDIFSAGPVAPNPPCGLPNNPTMYGCYQKPPNARVDPEGQYQDPLDSNNILTGSPCPAFGDFNRDGRMDVCYSSGLISQGGVSQAVGFWVIQGGDLDLSVFTVSLGLRFYY